MLRPRKMCRVLIAGPAGSLEKAVGALHRAGTLHITDYNEQYPGFRLGTPLPSASALSDKLLRLRAASKVLGIDEETQPSDEGPTVASGRDMDGLLAELGQTVAAKNAEKQELEARLQEARRNIEAIRPFTALALPFECFGAYESVAAYAGSVRVPIGAEVAAITPRFELFHAPDWSFFSLFVDIRSKAAVEKVLARSGYTEAKVPLAAGDPRQMLEKYRAVAEEAEQKLVQLNAGLREARQKYLNDIVACQRHLSVEVEKAESPLRFAASRSSFIIEGWIPSDEVDRTENALLKASGASVYLERMEEREWLPGPGAEHGGGSGHADPPTSAEMGSGGAPRKAGGQAQGPSDAEAAAHEDAGEPHDPYEDVPVALANPRPVRPFEMLTEMFSTPGYKEIDPTFVLALVFPFFFGLMVGDLAYGILLMVTGVFFVTKLKRFDGFRELGLFILVAGLIAAIFGAFVFGDAFGIPFHAAGHGEGASELSWASLGVDIPIKASIHKLEVSGLASLLMISVLAGIIHLCLGNLFGVVNEWRHNRRHAVATAGWFCAVLGFGLVMLKAGEVTSLGKWLWSVFPAALGTSWDPGFGVVFPYSSLALLGGGIAMAIAGEGGMAMMEVPAVLSNLLSYSRLAAIAIAKGAMAFAFNSILIPMVQGGNVGLLVFGWVLLVLAHMLVFVLGGLSSGIQSLRLNLVEFFMKFYKGGGVKFNPFGGEKISKSEESGA